MNFAIILSGGVGTRMRTDGFPKQYLEIFNKPILAYTLETFDSNDLVDKIIIVADPVWQSKIREWLKHYNVKKFEAFAEPGKSRQGSILNGLKECIKYNKNQTDNVIIHDAVRPLVSSTLIQNCFNQLDKYDGCMPVLPVVDTIYYSENGVTISNLLDRNCLYSGQSPEAFNLQKYYDINKDLSAEELDAIKGTTEIAYKNNLNICLIKGDTFNYKLTTPTDLNRFKNDIGNTNESI